MGRLKLSLLVLSLLMLAGSAIPAFADSYSKTLSMFKQYDAVRPFFKESYGYAVFPTVGKGGIVVGAAFGLGQVYEQGKLTGTVQLSKVSIGFQLGGQAFSQIIFFQDKRAYDEFTSGSFEFDASVSAIVITASAQAKAGSEGGTAGASVTPSTGAQAENYYHRGLVVFVHAKGGLMYEASIGGQKFDFTPL